MTEEFYKHMMAELHELNMNIKELTKELSRLKKYMVELNERVVWVQQQLGLKRMKRSRRGGPSP